MGTGYKNWYTMGKQSGTPSMTWHPRPNAYDVAPYDDSCTWGPASSAATAALEVGWAPAAAAPLSTLIQRRTLRLKAKLESNLSYCSLKRLAPGSRRF